MDMMNGIAAMSMSLSAAKLQQSASIAVQKKVMESQDLALQEMQEMLPPQEHQLDVYA